MKHNPKRKFQDNRSKTLECIYDILFVCLRGYGVF